MNVSIATVAEDVGTTVTGIQAAITAYTLVMAALMLTGAKIGALIGRKRAFSIGCVIYAAGSLTTALAPSLPVLLLGWSFLEGVGAALILPAIVALVAANFAQERRPARVRDGRRGRGDRGGGRAADRRLRDDVLLLALGVRRRGSSWPRDPRPRPEAATRPSSNARSSTSSARVLSRAGLGLIVFGVLKSGDWGWIQPKPGGAELVRHLACRVARPRRHLRALAVLRWEERLQSTGREPLVELELLRSRRLRSGLTMFFFQYLVQAGVFFVVPLYLSVALGLSAIATGVRVLPLSITLLISAVGVPRVFPHASPRLVVRVGLFALLAGTLVLLAAISPTSGPEVVLVPMLLIGLGIGTLASQLGAVTVSAVPDEKAPQVGGAAEHDDEPGRVARHRARRLDHDRRPHELVPERDRGATRRFRRVSSENAQVTLASGVPFISDQQLEAALDEANVPPRQADAAMEHYRSARIDGLESALAILALRDGARALRHPAAAAHSARGRGCGAVEAPLMPAAAPLSPALSMCSVERIATEWRTLRRARPLTLPVDADHRR